MEKKTLSVRGVNIVKNIVVGAAWCLFGIFNLFENAPCKFLAAAFLIVAAIASAVLIFAKKEADDEMSSQHMNKAQAQVYSVMMILVLMVGFVSISRNELIFNFRQVYPFVIGLGETLVGIFFIRFEKVGD